MEHCTTRFFETCDLDNDKYIALDEWAGCFGIKERECLSKGATVLCPLCASLTPFSALPVRVGLAFSGAFWSIPFLFLFLKGSTRSVPRTILVAGRHLERG